MIHALLFGILLGFGAAIPIGPINLEMVRRNLLLGARYGLALGCGACLADLTYLIALSTGALVVLSHAHILRVVGIVSALILAWFGYQALRSHQYEQRQPLGHASSSAPVWRHLAEGYALTLFNPYTILFWSSISVQIANLTRKQLPLTVYAGIGVLIATFLWAISLNATIHLTRHKFSIKTTHTLNIIGGLILLGFAAAGLWHALLI